MTLKRKVKQGWEDNVYEEEDYQYLKQKMTEFKKIHDELESVYSTRSINAMFSRLKDEDAGIEVKPQADKVSIHGVFDCHLFKRYEESSVDALIQAWRHDLTVPHMHNEVDMGPPSLGPITVLSGTAELRRVGQMLHPPYGEKPVDEDAVEAYKKALKADPDVERLLKAQYGN